MAESQLVLAKKLIEVMQEVKSVQKRGDNAEQGYKFVRAADVAIPIRKALIARGVLILPSVVDKVFWDKATKSGTQQRGCDLTIEYKLLDSESGETLTIIGFGSGVDSGDKYSYKAHTGAWKYAVRMLFMLPDEKGDPEYQEKTYGDHVKAFAMTAVVQEAKIVKKEVLAKVTNGLGTFIWRIPDAECEDAKKLLNAEGDERDAMVIDTGSEMKGLHTFRIVKLDPNQAEIARLTKGEDEPAESLMPALELSLVDAKAKKAAKQ